MFTAHLKKILELSVCLFLPFYQTHHSVNVFPIYAKVFRQPQLILRKETKNKSVRICNSPTLTWAEQNSINQFTDSKAMLINALCANVQNNEDCLTFIELFDVIYACRGTT